MAIKCVIKAAVKIVVESIVFDPGFPVSQHKDNPLHNAAQLGNLPQTPVLHWTDFKGTNKGIEMHFLSRPESDGPLPRSA